MGIGVIIHGYIECPGFARSADTKRVYRANRRVILGLPISDRDWPYLTRDMFSMLPLRPSIDRRIAQYENQVIHFAGDYKDMYRIEAGWLRKFEGLLSRLCWYRAAAMIEDSWFRYEWRVSFDHIGDRYHSNPPRPPTEWTFKCSRMTQQPLLPNEAIGEAFDSPHHVPGNGGT